MYGLHFDLVSAEEIELAHEIELSGYPADEAGSLDTFKSRQRNAPDLFLGAYLSYEQSAQRETLIGFICATLSSSSHLTHDSMSTHVPTSSSVCIHSVCVSASHRRKGVASALLQAYLERMAAKVQDGVERVLLICHEELRGFYESVGFEWVGASEVVHVSRPWFEMRKVLAQPPILPPATEQPPPGLWEALQRASSSRNRPIARLLSSFPNGVEDVVERINAETKTNTFELLCPREGCGSLILKKGAAIFKERESVKLEPPEHAVTILPTLPTPPSLAPCWLVSPSPMAFENIGFSRPVPSDQALRKTKFLACAECDLGPLGWCEEGGSEFWLACSRVGYRES